MVKGPTGISRGPHYAGPLLPACRAPDRGPSHLSPLPPPPNPPPRERGTRLEPSCWSPSSLLSLLSLSSFLAFLPLLPGRGVARGREKRAGVMRVFRDRLNRQATLASRKPSTSPGTGPAAPSATQARGRARLSISSMRGASKRSAL